MLASLYVTATDLYFSVGAILTLLGVIYLRF